MRGDTSARLVANAEEQLVLHVMSAEVSIILARLSGDGVQPPPKLVRSIENSLSYLDEKLEALLVLLPDDRALSFVEVALFCIVTHLPFRQIMEVAQWQHLGGFCQRFAARESARTTEYRFDTA